MRVWPWASRLQAEVTIRGRVTEAEPEVYVRLFWTWGGQGLGGDPVGGEWTAVRPTPPVAGATTADEEDSLLAVLAETSQTLPVLVERGGTYHYHWLRMGVWSPELSASAFRNNRLYFLTVYAEGCQPRDYRKKVPLRRAVFEFEIREDG